MYQKGHFGNCLGGRGAADPRLRYLTAISFGFTGGAQAGETLPAIWGGL